MFARAGSRHFHKPIRGPNGSYSARRRARAEDRIVSWYLAHTAQALNARHRSQAVGSVLPLYDFDESTGGSVCDIYVFDHPPTRLIEQDLDASASLSMARMLGIATSMSRHASRESCTSLRRWFLSFARVFILSPMFRSYRFRRQHLLSSASCCSREWFRSSHSCRFENATRGCMPAYLVFRSSTYAPTKNDS